MTDLRKAAEDLLEVVEAAIKAGDWKVDGACDLDLAIVRLRQALAQPEQEPVAWIEKDVLPLTHIIKAVVRREKDEQYVVPLYTAPPKREWVGLTDEERVSFFTKSQNKFWDWDDGVDIEAFIRAIETKLKEKNGA